MTHRYQESKKEVPIPLFVETPMTHRYQESKKEVPIPLR